MTKMKIIFIEDERIIAKIMGKFLQKMGHEPIASMTAKEGLEELEKQSSEISLIIIDYHLPDMECAELVSKIRKINESIPIIVSTGEIASSIQKELGVEGALQKPFDFMKFKTTVELNLQ